MYDEIYRELCIVLSFLFLICLIWYIYFKVLLVDIQYIGFIIHYLVATCSLKTIVQTKLSHLLWENESRYLLWVVMTQNSALLALTWVGQVQSVCQHPQHSTEPAVLGAPARPWSRVCSCAQGRGLLGGNGRD